MSTPDVPVEILVQWEPGATEAERKQALDDSGGLLKDVIHTATMMAQGEGVLEVIQLPETVQPEKALDYYKELSGVRYAEINQILVPQAVSDDPGYTNGSLWGMYGSDAPSSVGPAGTTNLFGSQAENAWDAGFIGSRSVYVGIIDEGVDYTHPDLAANVWSNPFEIVDGVDNDGNGYVDDIRGWDFAANDNTIFDGTVDDHGTHVAGTIGAVGGNGQGVAGVNWNVTMIPVKFLGSTGGTLSGAVMALDYLTDLKRRHGLNIVASNNSWGGAISFSRALQDAIVRAAKQDILFIAAAGNQGSDNDVTSFYPASTNTTLEAGYDSVVAVSGLQSDGVQRYNYGASSVDLGAPAVSIYSTLPMGLGGYGTYSGTSMATPHITGAVALYAAKYPNSSARQIRSALLSSTTPTASLAGKTVTGGRLNVQNFLNTTVPPEFSIEAVQAYLNEGQTGSTSFGFRITRKGESSSGSTVSWAVSGRGSNPADAVDFVGQNFPSSSLYFAPGQITQTINIDVRGDSLVESPEDFAVTLSNPTSGASLGNASAYSTILNDDTVTTIFNSSRITIPSLGSALPSPSSLSVSIPDNLPIGALEISLYNITHVWPDDLDILLVGPTGAKSILMSDVGGGVGINERTLTFSSIATQALPDSTELFSGIYRPSDFQVGDIFTNSSAPAGPYVADLSIFSGTDPNGIWSLYVQDDASSANGYIADGWSLSITTGPVITLAASPASVAEDGPTNLIYTFTRTGDVTSSLVVNYSVGGTAALGTDYTGITGTPATVTFAAGSATATVTVDPTADGVVEPDETVALTLTAGNGYTIGTPTAVVGTIANDDAVLPVISLAVSPASVAEDGTGNLIYTFTRTGDTTSSLIVNYDVGGTATLGTDYTGIAATPATVTFAAGSATATVTVDPTVDSTVEPDETVALMLTAGSGYTVGTTGAVVATIANDDVLPVISLAVSPASVAEDGLPNLVYTFTRTGDTTSSLVVTYSVGGTAALGTDYTGIAATPATVTFAAGSATATVTVDPTADGVVEPDETVALTLIAGSGYTIGTPAAVVGTIANDDVLPVVSLAVSPASVAEDGTGNLIYTFTRTGSTTAPLSVDYSVGGTATLGTDYAGIAATPATVTFAAGSATATVTVDPTADSTVEPDETVALTLTAGNGYTIGTQTAVVGTIANDDVLPVISLAVSPASVAEDGLVNLVYTFTRTGDTTSSLVVNYNVGGTATLGTDYTGIATTPATVTFAAGSATATVTVDPTADGVVEGDETVALTLTAGNGYTIGTQTAVVGTIANDDVLPVITLAVSPASVAEDGTGNLIYTFTRTGSTTAPLSVDYSVGGTATQGTDYTGIAATPATVTFAAGSATATVTVDPTADGVVEPDETVALTLTAGNGYTIGTQTAVVGTIANDDVLPVITLAVSPASVAEDGTGNLIYTFTRTGSTASALSVDYSVGGTATLGKDYAGIAATPATVTFAAGSATATVTVDPTADGVVEGDETVALTLTAGNGYTIGTQTAVVGTIANDDVLPVITLAVSPASVAEDGTGNLIYTFTRTGSTTAPLSVDYSVGGTATQGTDYTGIAATPATVTFAAGSATATVTVDPTADGVVEPDETVALTLTAGNGYTIGTQTAVVGTIANDDVLPEITLAVSPASAAEDGLPNLVYTFTRTGDTTSSLVVTYNVGGTATLGTDYTGIAATPATVTFAEGSATAMVTVDPTADGVVEPDETVALTLTAGNGYTIGTQTAVVGTIANDDVLPEITLAVSPASAAEDGLPNLVYAFTRTGDTTSSLVVTYNVGGTATLGTDYTGIEGTPATIIFAAGSATATVTVDPTADWVVEPDETVALTLTAGNGYTIGTQTAVVGTIANDDVLPEITLAVSPASAAEDGLPNLVYTFTRTGDTTSSLVVTYNVGGTATLGTDYTGIAGTPATVTFAAGSATATVTVDPTVDSTVEPDETVALTLSTGSGYTVGTTGAVVGTIANDDAVLPVISLAVSPASVAEDGPANLIYTFTRTGSTTSALTVSYSVGGTATLGTDYTGIGGTPATVTFAAGSAIATVTVDPTADSTVEPDETVALTLTAGNGYTIGTPTAVVGTIANDDAVLPVISLAVSPASVAEDGPANLIYTFTRTGDTTSSLIVNYDVGGTATLGTDYTGIAATPATVTFAAGSATATVTVDPTADGVVEPDETVALTLSTGSGYTVGTTGAVVGTIANDDAVLPVISLAVSPASVAEDGPANLIYTFTRTGSTTSALTVSYSVGGTATLGTDYTGIGGTPATVTFAAGSATATVTVDPTADGVVEGDETVALTLSTGSGYTVGTTGAVVGTIANDDAVLPVISLAVSPASVAEDGPANLIYTFTRTGSTTSALTVSYSVGGTATLGTDYTGIGGTPATVTFAAGSAIATVTVDPTADGVVEGDETVALTLSTGSGYTVGTTGAVVGTIANDDSTTPPTPPSTPVALPRPMVITAFDLDGFSSSPLWEQVGNAFDNTVSSKYLNHGGANAGVEFSYGVPTRLSSFVIATANDVPGRDPASYQIYGFNGGSWQLLTSGALQLPAARLSDGPAVVLPELPMLSQYRVIFPALKESGEWMQIAELKLYGTQSSAPASIAVGALSKAGAFVGAMSSDALISFGDQGRVTDQLPFPGLDVKADGIIQATDLGPGRVSTLPIYSGIHREMTGFPQIMASTSRPITSTFQTATHEDHAVQGNMFPALSSSMGLGTLRLNA